MKKIKKVEIEPIFVEFISDVLEKNKIYISEDTVIDKPKQSTKDRILSETPELIKQKVRDTANSLVDKQKTLDLTDVDILELMRRAYNAGFNQYDIVEAGLEGKDTETDVRWILSKYQSEKLENSKRKRNFYCGDKVDYDEQCLEQCDGCIDCTGVDYGYYDQN